MGLVAGRDVEVRDAVEPSAVADELVDDVTLRIGEGGAAKLDRRRVGACQPDRYAAGSSR